MDHEKQKPTKWNQIHQSQGTNVNFLTLLNSAYLFSEICAMVTESSEKSNQVLNFRVRMLLKGTVKQK